MTVGEAVRSIRKKRGLSQAELAARSRVSRTHISYIESGRSQPTVPTLARIANALQTELQIEFRDPVDASRLPDVKELLLLRSIDKDALSVAINGHVLLGEDVERMRSRPWIEDFRRIRAAGEVVSVRREVTFVVNGVREANLLSAIRTAAAIAEQAAAEGKAGPE